MPSSVMLRLVVLLRTDVSEECITSIIRVTIGELGTTLAVTARSVLQLLVSANVAPSSEILVNLMMEAIRSSETSVLRKDTRRNSHRRKHLKS
jgi:hypothetical protein